MVTLKLFISESGFSCFVLRCHNGQDFLSVCFSKSGITCYIIVIFNALRNETSGVQVLPRCKSELRAVQAK